MAKRKPLPPEPNWRANHPEYEARFKDMEREFDIPIRMGVFMRGDENVYQAWTSPLFVGSSQTTAVGDSPDEALRNLHRKLSEPK